MRYALLPRILVAMVLMALPALTTAQQGTTLSGTITQGESGQPMAGALVVIDELRLETRTDAEGLYTFDGVPPGSYHVGVRAEGYTTRRTEVTVASQPVRLDVAVEFDLHFAEVLSVSPPRGRSSSRISRRPC